MLPAMDSAEARISGTLASRVSYGLNYVGEISSFVERCLTKTVLPYQVEFQPGRLKGKALCWLSCSYCYGGASENTGERLSPERMLAIAEQTANGPHGGVKKLIYAGYATDPLNYEYIDDLVDAGIRNRQVIGIHTKLIKISDRLVALLTDPNVKATGYITVSVDAGSSASYNATHSVSSKADVFGRVVNNIRSLARSRRASGGSIEITANYLVTRANNATEEVEKAIRILGDAGVDLLRFSFPQLPYGQSSNGGTLVPGRAEVEEYYTRLRPVIDAHQGGSMKVVVLDADGEHGIDRQRTLPCMARFIYPTVGFDGYFAHCSQSAAPHFRDMMIANLAETDFWDAYYDYDADNFWSYMKQQYALMNTLGCRCDRKEHVVNSLFAGHEH